MTQALSYTCDPRRLVARGDTDIKSFYWRGVFYVRDDQDTITPDTTGLVAPEFVGITVRPGVVVPTENAVICIVSADGWRFKPALTKPSGLAPFDADWNAVAEAIRKGSGT